MRGEQRLRALFDAASELAPPARDEFLTRECAGDAQLRAELDALLESDARMKGTTAQPLIGAFAQLLEPHASLLGRRVGAWELREEVGRGGMGTVYRRTCRRQHATVGAIKFVQEFAKSRYDR